jgi:hypothetical protein
MAAAGDLQDPLEYLGLKESGRDSPRSGMKRGPIAASHESGTGVRKACFSGRLVEDDNAFSRCILIHQKLDAARLIWVSE